MKIIMHQTLGTPHGCYRKGRLYDVPEATGSQWIKAGLAKPEPPPTPPPADVPADTPKADKPKPKKPEGK